MKREMSWKAQPVHATQSISLRRPRQRAVCNVVTANIGNIRAQDVRGISEHECRAQPVWETGEARMSDRRAHDLTNLRPPDSHPPRGQTA